MPYCTVSPQRGVRYVLGGMFAALATSIYRRYCISRIELFLYGATCWIYSRNFTSSKDETPRGAYLDETRTCHRTSSLKEVRSTMPSDSIIKVSPSATLQNGIININGGLTIQIPKEFRLDGFFGKALSPRRAKKAAKTLEVATKSITESMGMYLQLYPNLSPERAYLMAITGLQFTQRNADNLLSVIDEAFALSVPDDDPDHLSDMAKDKILEGAKEADDENVRQMWADLIIGEMRNPGSFSRRTLSILAGMDTVDAQEFASVCGYSTELYVLDSPGAEYYQPIPVLSLDENRVTYNRGAISIQAIDNLVSMGLLSKSISKAYYINSITEANFLISFRFESRALCLINRNSTKRQIVFPITFTKNGRELSRLCALGNNPNVGEVAERMAESVDLEYKWCDIEESTGKLIPTASD